MANPRPPDSKRASAGFVPLLPRVIELAQGVNFAVLTTLMPDGAPQSHVMWIDSDGEYLLVNTAIGRLKHKNMVKDQRVTVTIWERENPYRFAEVRGRVIDTVPEPEARDHVTVLCLKYQGKAPDPELIAGERVIMKIAAERQYTHTAPRPMPPPSKQMPSVPD